VALARTGIVAIENQHFGDALDAFTKAAALRPNDASLCFGAGVAAFMLGRDEVARDRFQCALTRNPDFLPASTWLADLHYRAGHLTEAISVYETLGRRSTLSRELQQQLEGWRKELALYGRFRTITSRHFIAQFEAPSDEALARTILERLEKADARIAGMLGVEPSQPITVVLYTREQYAEITRLASWSIAAYDGRIRVPLAAALDDAGELDRLVSHELVHAVVAALGGRAVPAWVNEGLATALEPAGTHHLESTFARTDERPALSKLHRSFVGLSPDDAQLAYATAARAMRRLIDERGAPAVVALLRDLAQGSPFDRAFERRLSMRYEDFAALVSRE
jgi:tetratricopeptide (TPR) repeat protein